MTPMMDIAPQNLRTVTQSFDFQLGHLLHRRLRIIVSSLGYLTRYSRILPLYPSGNRLSVIVKCVHDLKKHQSKSVQHFISNRTYLRLCSFLVCDRLAFFTFLIFNRLDLVLDDLVQALRTRT